MPEIRPEEQEIYNRQYGDASEGEANAPQWLKGKVRVPAVPTVKVSPAASRRTVSSYHFWSKGGAWGVILAAISVVLMIAGIVLHAKYAQPNAICRSGVGQLGQAFSRTAFTDCRMAESAEGAVGPLLGIGIIGLSVSALGIIRGVVSVAQRKRGVS